jgi:hypothetical protein
MADPRAEAPATDVLAAEEFGVPAPDPVFHLRSEPASDVLAAEEFGVPAPDPVFRDQVGPPTDVLAAEEFGVPAPDPAFRHETLSLPEDLVGDEPRDVLVAEEFAMPAPDEARVSPHPVSRRGLPIARVLALALPVVSAGVYLRRRRQRG